VVFTLALEAQGDETTGSCEDGDAGSAGFDGEVVPYSSFSWRLYK
jgi:hypothetical protein